MDPARARRCRLAAWLPRPRGDGPVARRQPRFRHTAPPPARGWTRERRNETRTRGGSSARAGQDRPRTPSRRGLERSECGELIEQEEDGGGWLDRGATGAELAVLRGGLG